MLMMYKLIGEAITESGKFGHPRYYLNFFCLGNREKDRGEFVPPDSPHPATEYWNALRHKSFMIYVHSKLVIVEDTYMLIGSANVNQRSMDWQRDTEIAIGCYQLQDGKPNINRRDIHESRISLWYEHIGRAEELFQEPYSLDCVQTIRGIGDQIWKIYSGEEVIDMEGVHLVTYPINVKHDGFVEDLENGFCYFPDMERSTL